MSILSNLVRKVSRPVATVASFIPTPQAQAVAFVSGQIAKDTERRKIKRQQEEQRAQIMEFFGNSSSIPTIQQNLARTTPVVSTASSGGGFLDTVRGGLREVGGFVSDVFSSGLPQLFGVSRPPSVGQQPALTTVTNIGAQESQGSGSIQAGAGSLLAPVLSGARNLLKTPQGQLALGGGGALIGSMFGGDGKQMRVTRKMKSQARMVLNMTGGNLAAAADILGIDQNTLVMILLKRFRNDGPVVTKAALRKTKQTIRRLHSMQDVLKSITPTATMRRRAPMKRATTTTLIKN
tara:strand:+ start:1210 stop:2088 length:879 start_codon:yes stop_codon:yes gene_type:complete